MAENGFNCKHYTAFPEHRGKTNERLGDLEGRMTAKTEGDKVRDQKIIDLRMEAKEAIGEMNTIQARTSARMIKLVIAVLAGVYTLSRVVDRFWPTG